MTRELPLLDASDVPVNPDAGFGAIECGQGRLPLIAMDVQANISEATAMTHVRQTFRNALNNTIEATYIFPLPDRAAVTEIRLRIGDRIVDGVLKERGAARADYDRAIESGYRATIAEEERSGVFTLRVGNIPAGEHAQVELTLVGPLPIASGEATYRFPLVVAPRYTPGIPLDGPNVGAGTRLDTDLVPDASRISPPVLLPGFPNPVKLSLTARFVGAYDEAWWSRVRSSLHTVVKTNDDNSLIMLPNERLNRDFILRFPVGKQDPSASARVASGPDDSPGVFRLSLFPPQHKRPAIPRRVVFLLDRSGSMDGWKMVAARRAVGRMVDTLTDDDEFSILAFDHEIQYPHYRLEPASDSNRWKAIEWLGRIDANGGTELAAALSAGLNLLNTKDETVDTMLVLVTDAQVADEDVVLMRLRAHPGRCPRIFSIGIDQAPNAGLLNKLAAAGNGVSELVESEARLDECMQHIHQYIGRPLLTDVRIIPMTTDVIESSFAPLRIPDVFPDRPVEIYGRCHSVDDVRFVVRAKLPNGSEWSSECTALADDSNSLLPMWGRAKIRDLEDECAASGCGKPLQDRIVAISLQSNVLSRFTAYVAVDDSEVIADGAPQRIIQPVEQPAGWMTRGARLRKHAAGESTVMYSARPDRNTDLNDFRDTGIDFTGLSAASPAQSGCSENEAEQWLRIMFQDAMKLRAEQILIQPQPDCVEFHFLIKGQWKQHDSAPGRLQDGILKLLRELTQLNEALWRDGQIANIDPDVIQARLQIEQHAPVTVHLFDSEFGLAARLVWVHFPWNVQGQGENG